MLDRLLLATDFSEVSRAAYEPAASLAREYGAKILLVHATSPIPPYCYEEVSVEFPTDNVYDLLRRRLEDEKRHAAFDGLEIETRLLFEGAPSDRVAELADEEKSELIILGTHGRTGLAHALLGSFAERVLRYSKVPVLTFRSNGAGLPERLAPRTALVPFDFSENAMAVFPFVRFLSTRYGTRFTFLHVIEPRHPLLDRFPSDQLLEHLQAEQARLPLEVELHFGEIREEHLAGVECHLVIRHGTPYAEIIDYAKTEPHDVILMSTHGRTGLKHFVLGSVAERIVRHAETPVLTVRPTEIRVGTQAGKNAGTVVKT
jgi:nucleotide-binding universal stress UspA family protein